MAENFPDTPPRELPAVQIPPRHNYRLHMTPDMVSSHHQRGLVHSGAALIRIFGNLVTPHQQVDIRDAFLNFVASEPTCSNKKKDNRSETHAWHLGIWEHTSTEGPKVTVDSRQRKSISNEKADLLLLALRPVLHRIGRIIERDYPDMWARAVWYEPRRLCSMSLTIWSSAHQRVVNSKHVTALLRKRPALDLGPVAFSVAVKEGGSELLHADFSDDFSHFSYVFAVGDWTGGAWSAPQTKQSYPIVRGDVLAARTHLLAHCSQPLQGRRFVFTLFTEKNLLKHMNLPTDV